MGKMRKYINENISKWLIAILLCGLCHTAAFAYGYNQSAQSKNWGYQPVYQSASTATTSSIATAPTYQFRTTSAYISASGASEPYRPMSGPGGPRRSIFDDDPGEEDDPSGVVPDPEPDVPVGDTPWCLILLLVTGYLAFHRRLRVKRLRRFTMGTLKG